MDRLDPRALTRALLGPRPRRRRGGPSSASVRGYHARRASQQAKALARGRLRAVAVDGKTSRGARRADGTRVHLLGAAEHGGHLLDHLEVDVKHNETSHFTGLLEPLDLDGAVVTFDALHTVYRSGQEKPAAAARPGQGPALAAGAGRQRHPRHRARAHRDPDPEGRPRQPPGLPARPPGHQDHPRRQDTATGRASRETVYAVTSRTGSGPANLATIRAAIKDAGYLHIPEGRRDHTTPAETLHHHGLD